MYDPNDPNDQMQAEAISATRPPQFNESTCGYRCGWGCSEPDGGGGGGGGGGDSESDTAPTLVGSEDEDAMGETVLREEPGASHSIDSRSDGVVDRDAGPIVLVDVFEESAELSQHFFAPGIPMITPQINGDYEESVNSLDNQAGSDVHSSATSDRRSVGSASPYGWTAGTGEWTKESKPNHFPGYFSMTPLRLSAQVEHCRGLVASHMVSEDFSTLLDRFEESWRGQLAMNDWGGPSYSEFPTW
jgi:hypothetical protein